MNTTRPRTARDRLGAVALIATPVVLGLGLAVHPEETSDEARQLEIIGRHASDWSAAHLLIYFGCALMVGAVVALVRVADRHGAKGAVGAGIVAGLGAVALAATAAVELVSRHLVESGVDVPARAAVYHAYEGASDLSVAVFVAAFALPAGLILLALVLWRSAALPRWAALALGLGALLAPLPVVAVRDVGALLLLVGMVTAARATLQPAPATWPIQAMTPKPPSRGAGVATGTTVTDR